MAKIHTIPDSLLQDCLSLSADGNTAQEIADWLKKEHNIDAAQYTVSRRIRELKKIEQEAKKLAIAQAAAATAIDCVQIMDENISILQNEAKRLLVSDNNQDKGVGNRLSQTLLAYISKKMDLTGMDKPDLSQTEQELIDGLLKKIGQ